MGQFDDIKGTKQEKKNQVKKTRSGGSSGRAGSDGVQVLTGSGVPADMLPCSVDDVGRLLPSWVSEWCDRNNITDVRKMSPLVFGAMCGDIGRNYIKPSRILKDKTRSAVGACVATTCNRYDVHAVEQMLDVYRQLCGSCDKVPFSSVFADFCGVSLAYVKEYVKGLTSMGFNIAQKTHDLEMDSLRRSVSRDPVGRLAILNNELWGGGVPADSVRGASVASLPADGSFSLISDRSMLE